MPAEPLDPARSDPEPDAAPPPPTEAPDDGSPGRPSPIAGRLDRIEQTLDELRARLERIGTQLGAEVRTGRLVIVEGDGFERVIVDGAGHFGALTLQARPQAAGSVAVEVFAADAHDGDLAHVGVALVDAGDVVAAVDVQSGRPAMIWTPTTDDERRPD